MTDPKQPDTDASSSVSKAPAGKGLALLALLVALAAAGAAGYGLWQQQGLRGLPAQLQGDAGKTEQLRRETLQRLTEIGAASESNAAAIADSRQALAEIAAVAAQVSQRLDGFDARLAALSGTTADRRNQLLRDEALYYLRVANAQATLAQDAAVAASALQLADEKLRETGDPSYTAVRARLSEEITALRAVPQIDTAGVIFRLQSLADQIDTWPLRNPVPERFSSAMPALDPAAEADAWARFRATLRAVFDSIVSVRQSDAPPEVQLTNAEYALVRAGVRAELQLARVTFVSGRYALFAASLARAQALIPEYFDPEATAVRAAIATLAELATTELPGALPDVSGSLSLMLSPGAPAAPTTGEAR